jgi:membrane protease YdiL (CAAX protease family)
MTGPDTGNLRLRPPFTTGQRGISLVEFVIGASVVIGHNVFHVVPNEVPILFVLALASIRLREGSWTAIGLVRPKSWPLTILMALAAAVTVIAMDLLVTSPLSSAMGLHHAKSAGTSLGLRRGDVLSLLKVMGVTWTLAAFGEEIVYRRYLLGRVADLGNNSTLAYCIALLCVTLLFGIGHYYQGPAGMFETACDGFVIGAAYLLSKRNLWVAVLAHGFVDTIAFGAMFLGLAD